VDLNWFNGSVEQLYALVGKDSQTQPYFVQEGDTLVSISEHFGIELRSLVEANPNLIHPGMLLTIPRPPSGARTVPEKGVAIYIVQPGDTLSAITERFDTTVERLALDNKVTDPSRIVAGQRLVIL
jgi:LysM repeat protein